MRKILEIKFLLFQKIMVSPNCLSNFILASGLVKTMDCEITTIRNTPIHREEPKRIIPMDAEAFNGVMDEIDRALNPPVVKKLTPAEWVEKWNESNSVGTYSYVLDRQRCIAVSRRTLSVAYIGDEGKAIVRFEGVTHPVNVRETYIVKKGGIMAAMRHG